MVAAKLVGPTAQGGILSKAERLSRLAAAEPGCNPSTLQVPRKLWPNWHTDTPCSMNGRQFVPFEGRTVLRVGLLIEAAWRVRLDPSWSLQPFKCGYFGCQNPHHWDVAAPIGWADESYPPKDKRHHGFWIKVDPETPIELAIAADSEWRCESAEFLHKRTPQYSIADIAACQAVLNQRLIDSTKAPKISPAYISDGVQYAPPQPSEKGYTPCIS